jgi:hypothetical protein
MDTPSIHLPKWSFFVPLFASSVAAFAANEPLDAVQKAASDWIKLRVETTRLEADWATERELLTSTITALTERAKKLEETRDVQLAKGTKNNSDLDTLREKNALALADVKAADDRMKAIDQELIDLRPKLPPRLSEALEMSYRSISADKLPPSERVQLTITILSRCVQFDRSITQCEEIVNTEGSGEGRSLDVIYWGASHAYALDRSKRKVWYGSPGEKTWKWEQLPGSFEEVSRLMAIQAGKADPAFVVVPARVANLGKQ